MEFEELKKMNPALGFLHFHVLTTIKLLSVLIIVFTSIITQEQSLCNNDGGSIFIHSFIYFAFFFISHTQAITIHYIYNSLQVTVIVYKKEIKRKGRTKSTKIL